MSKKSVVKREMSFGQEEPFVPIVQYPKYGKGIVRGGGTGSFNSDVTKFCSKEHTSSEEDTISKAEKVILVGDHSVGKTCLIRRYCDNDFTDGYKATIGVDFMFKQYKILGREFTIHIWDTAGQEQFRCVSKSYFRGATAVVVAFDLGNPSSLKNAKDWLDDVRRENSDELLIFLVGNKADAFHVVSEQEALDAATMMNAEYWETSARQNTNVKELFERVATITFEESILRLDNLKDVKKTEIGSSSLFLGNEGNNKTTRKCCLS